MNSLTMYDPTIIRTQVVIAQLGMAIGQKMLSTANEAAFRILLADLNIKKMESKQQLKNDNKF